MEDNFVAELFQINRSRSTDAGSRCQIKSRTLIVVHCVGNWSTLQRCVEWVSNKADGSTTTNVGGRNANSSVRVPLMRPVTLIR